MSLDIRSERLDENVAIVVIEGALTLGTNLKTVDANVQQLVLSGVNQLIIDVTHCSHCDSAGLGFLVHTYGMASERGGALRLCGVPPQLARLLKMTRTDTLLPCDPDRAASTTALQAWAAGERKNEPGAAI